MGINEGHGGRLRRLRAALVVIVGLTVGVLAAPSVAFAVNHDNQCDEGPNGEYCMNQHVFFQGAFRDDQFNVSNYSGLHYINSPVALNDQNSSGANHNTSLYLLQYEHANYGGRHLDFNKYPICGGLCHSYDNFVAKGFNDIASSHKFVSSLP